MVIYKEIIKLKTSPYKFYDITGKVEKIVQKSDIRAGICLVFCPGSTGSVIVNENDSALIDDIRAKLEEIAPKTSTYRHPNNAHSHIRAVFLGASETIPVENNKLVLGTWQSIIFVENDIRSRNRDIMVSVIGE